MIKKQIHQIPTNNHHYNYHFNKILSPRIFQCCPTVLLIDQLGLVLPEYNNLIQFYEMLSNSIKAKS